MRQGSHFGFGPAWQNHEQTPSRAGARLAAAGGAIKTGLCAALSRNSAGRRSYRLKDSASGADQGL